MLFGIWLYLLVFIFVCLGFTIALVSYYLVSVGRKKEIDDDLFEVV